MTRRVVVTGIGAITPIGSGRLGFWNGLKAGESAVGPISRFDARPFPCKIAAEVVDFDPLDYLDARRAHRLDRFSQFAVAASRQAIADAALRLDRERSGVTAVCLGSALGGIAFAEEQHRQFLGNGFHAVEPTLALTVFGGAGAANVAIDVGARGPILGNANSCSSGLNAIGEASRLIRSGVCLIALAGGAEAPLAPLTFGAFARVGAMSSRNDSPKAASRPFDSGRDGFVMSEGAAVLVLEEAQHALNRGARPYAEIVGFGATNDAYNMIVPLPTGEEAARAIALALADARVEPGAIEYVNAHATGTRLGDVAEARAIRLAFGDHADQLPVSATKGLHGHALGASGAIEAAITVLALFHSWLPRTANLDIVDADCDLPQVLTVDRATTCDLAITNSFGFGGVNASLVVRRWPE